MKREAVRRTKGKLIIYCGGGGGGRGGGILGDHMVSRVTEGISRHQQSIKGRGNYGTLTANEGRTLKYYRTLGGDQVNFSVTLTQPISPTPPKR